MANGLTIESCKMAMKGACAACPDPGGLRSWSQVPGCFCSPMGHPFLLPQDASSGLGWPVGGQTTPQREEGGTMGSHLAAGLPQRLLGGPCLQREDTGLQRAVPLLSHLVRAQIPVCWGRCVPCLCTEVEKSEDGRKACLYRNLARTEFGVTCFSYCTSVINHAFLPYIFTQNNIIFGSLSLQILLYGIIGNLTVITPALLHFVTNVCSMRPL